MNQIAVAKKLGISAANLCKIETRNQTASPQKAPEIAEEIVYSETLLVGLQINQPLPAEGLKLGVNSEVP